MLSIFAGRAAPAERALKIHVSGGEVASEPAAESTPEFVAEPVEPC